ncbi:RNA recognition motif (RRM) domain [Geosmithia morbida]|uniref:RNA recognition motif (RRM) domain n=1 Tax=Geosmithia morbida TaxID=1094350 RepID=A0A9P5CYW8_9HYPO|nr:RNA recognition motif (RRM) domain [Geosmithia morbida]KAF4119837.1 RNA recognition motif (RRM) domain [Geosmithia morbida]
MSVPARSLGRSGGLRKTNSYSILANYDASSEDEDCILPDGGVRLGSRLKTLSMSAINNELEEDTSSDDASNDVAENTTATEPADDLTAHPEPPCEEDNVPEGLSETSDEAGTNAANGPVGDISTQESSDVPVFTGEEDPQEIYSPSACVFVANLTLGISDSILAGEVYRIFSQFGTVFVKIRRDSAHMPFAFCQYTTGEDAQRAIQGGHGIVLLGRECRTELAKANSVFVVRRTDGGPITEPEARNFMSPLGDIMSIEPLDGTMQHQLGMSVALVVRYRVYNPARDISVINNAQKKFLAFPFDAKRMSRTGRPYVSSDRPSGQARYEVDRRSAYLGNLPLDFSQREFNDMAAKCGNVVKVSVNHKIVAGGKEIVFCFVEFTQSASVDGFVHAYDGSELRGYIMRAQHKLTRKQQEDEAGSLSGPGSHPAAFPGYQGICGGSQPSILTPKAIEQGPAPGIHHSGGQQLDRRTIRPMQGNPSLRRSFERSAQTSQVATDNAVVPHGAMQPCSVPPYGFSQQQPYGPPPPVPYGYPGHYAPPMQPPMVPGYTGYYPGMPGDPLAHMYGPYGLSIFRCFF